MSGVNFLAAVLIVSEDPERLAGWYRDVLGLPVEAEEHESSAPHFGCNVHGLHFAIHPISNYSFAPETGPGGIRIAFNVTDIAQLERHLEAHSVDWVFRPVELGWSTMLAVRDPDGNLVEAVQMARRRQPAG